MRTSSPTLCTWMRAPSIFHSNATSPPSCLQRLARRPPPSARASARSARRARAGTASEALGALQQRHARHRAEAPGVHRRAPHLRDRQSGGRGDRIDHDAASAPCRSSPVSRRSRNCCSRRRRTREQLAQRLRRAAPRTRRRAAAASSVQAAIDIRRATASARRPRVPAAAALQASRSRCRCVPAASLRRDSARRSRSHRARARAARPPARAPWPGGCRVAPHALRGLDQGGQECHGRIVGAAEARRPAAARPSAEGLDEA